MTFLSQKFTASLRFLLPVGGRMAKYCSTRSCSYMAGINYRLEVAVTSRNLQPLKTMTSDFMSGPSCVSVPRQNKLITNMTDFLYTRKSPQEVPVGNSVLRQEQILELINKVHDLKSYVLWKSVVYYHRNVTWFFFFIKILLFLQTIYK